MNNSDNEGNRGASITPSPRPSIHKHDHYCPFALSEVTMGRYGLSEINAQNQCSTSNCSLQRQGHDEVDNVLSKHAPSVSPRSLQQQKTKRRNSLTTHKEISTDSDESYMFSKSLPENIPSRSYYSNNSNEMDQNESQTSNQLNISNTVKKRKNNKRQNSQVRNVNIINYPQQRELESDLIPGRSQQFTQQNRIECDSLEEISISNSRIIWLLIILTVGFAIALPYNVYDLPKMFSFNNGVNPTNMYNMVQFYNDLYNLGKKYKIDEDSLLKLQMGVTSIFEKQDTGSFMFVYNSKTKYFNPTTFNAFINEIAFISAKYLRNESTTVRHITIDSSTLVERDPTELIDKYKGDVDKGGVMLLREIDMLPSSLAMALHYYCDEYNPLVKKSAMFFTLDLAHCSRGSEQRLTHAHIEKCLSNKWILVPADNIGPLLTRVVNVVVDLTSTF